uniref:Probable magnesium transporter n=1 Tax=Auxenochlorella protothecoides TaxID=3075 RepID=A0A1D2AHY4_AUXPR
MAPALQGLSALGAVLHVGGSLLIVVGQTVVKISHCIKESSGMPHTWLVPRHASPKPQWQRPDGQWRRLLVGSRAYAVAGWGLFAGGNLLRFVSMRFASQTVLSGLGSLQFVLIPVASQALLGVRADRSAALGVLVVVAGNVLIVWHGPGDVEYSVAALRALWQARTMRAFLLAMALALTALQLIWWELRAAAKAQRLTGPFAMLGAPPAHAARWADGAAAFDPAGGPAPLARRESLGFALPWSGTWVTADAAQVFTGALLYSAVASMIGAWSVLFSKSLTYVVSELPDSLADPYGWFVAAAFLGTAAWWIRQSNQGLRLYPASLIMPLMQAFWMCMSVLEGGIYFQELDHLPASSIWLLMTGLVMALAGAIFMGSVGARAGSAHAGVRGCPCSVQQRSGLAIQSWSIVVWQQNSDRSPFPPFSPPLQGGRLRGGAAAGHRERGAGGGPGGQRAEDLLCTGSGVGAGPGGLRRRLVLCPQGGDAEHAPVPCGGGGGPARRLCAPRSGPDGAAARGQLTAVPEPDAGGEPPGSSRAGRLPAGRAGLAHQPQQHPGGGHRLPAPAALGGGGAAAPSDPGVPLKRW